MVRLAARGLCAVILLLALTGCWNRREVNDVAIVSAAAIDKGTTEKVRLTVQFIRPGPLQGSETGASAGGTQVFVESSEGATLHEALERLSHQLPRLPSWEHNNVLIFSEELAREGLSDLLDFFIRNHWSRLDQWVLISPGEAAPMLSAHFDMEPNTGMGFRRLYRQAWIRLSEVAPSRLHEFMQALFAYPTSPVAGMVTSIPAELRPLDGATDRKAWIGGAAVFRGDRMVGSLSDQEARALQWLRNRVIHSSITVPCLEGELEGIGLQILGSRTKIEPEWHEGSLPRIRLPIRLSTKLGGQMCREDLSTPEALKKLEVRVAAQIQAEMVHVLKILQKELKADPIGVGDALHRKYPKQWKSWKGRWEEVFAELEIDPEVTVQLVQTGTTVGKPLPTR